VFTDCGIYGIFSVARRSKNMSATVVNKDNFEEVVKNSDKPVLIDFYADWCQPCKILSPILDEIATEMGDKVVVGKVNVDDNQELAAQFGVMSIPTVIMFKDGDAATQWVGVQDKQTYISAISS